MTQDLTRKTITGVRLTFAASVMSGLIQAGVLVVLARLLTPLDYGLVAGSLAVVRPLQLLLFSGLERAVILHGRSDPDELASITGLNLMIGAAAFIAVAALAGLAWLTPAFRGYSLTLLTLAPVLFASGLGVAWRAVLRQRMAFGKLALADIVSQVCGQALVAIALARAGFGPFSLIAGYLVQALILVAMNWFSAGKGAVRWPRRAVVAPLLRLSFAISKSSVLELVHVQLPPIVVGAALGPLLLGLFNRAYSLIQLPVELMGTAMSRVLYSGFSLVREDVERLRRACRTLVELGSAAIIPVCCGMGAAGPDLVHVVLGDKWGGAVPVVPWIALGAMTALVAHFYAVLTEASIQLEARWRVQLWATATLLVALLLGVRFGIVGGAAAFALGNLVFLIGNIGLASRILDLPPRRLLSWSAPATITGLCLIAYVIGIRWALPTLAATARLAIEVAGCGVLFGGLYLLFWRRTALEFVRYSGAGRFLPGLA